MNETHPYLEFICHLIFSLISSLESNEFCAKNITSDVSWNSFKNINFFFEDTNHTIL